MSLLISSLMGGGVVLGLTGGVAALLGRADKAFHVDEDPRIGKIRDLLPGANCGGCGFVGCGDYAEAVVKGEADPTCCPAGGEACAKQIGDLLGIAVSAEVPRRAVVHCSATWETRMRRGDYSGEKTCASATHVTGVQDCVYGCLGFGDCAVTCPFDALTVRDGLATVDTAACTGCGKCLEACPRGLIRLEPFVAETILAVTCNNPDRGPDVRSVCSQGCIGCRACTRACPSFRMNGQLAEIDYSTYDPHDTESLEAAVASCRMGGIRPIGPLSKPTEPITQTEKESS